MILKSTCRTLTSRTERLVNKTENVEVITDLICDRFTAEFEHLCPIVQARQIGHFRVR